MTSLASRPSTLTRLKHVVALRRSRDDGAQEASPYIGLENIESATGRLVGESDSPDRPTPLSTGGGESLSNVFEPGDVLFGKLRPYLAKAWVATFPGRCTTELLVMQPVAAEARFLRYVLLSPEFIDAVDASTFGSKMPRADWDTIGNMAVPVPQPSQQRAIADYLDRETGRLDRLVAAKERVLGLLAEKRRALITRAVTRGLDPSAPLRPSGVPWLGPIPAHWHVSKIAYFAKVGNGSTPARDNLDFWSGGDYPWLNSSVVNQEEVTAADQFVTAAALSGCHLPRVPPGSVLIGITGQGKTRGMAAVLRFEATINQHLAFITTDPRSALPEYLRLVFVAAYGYMRDESDSGGSTKGAITCEQLSQFRVPGPPLQEQQTIVAHITAETAKLDAMRAAIERTIALLTERRAALIAAAVTGTANSGLFDDRN